VSCDIVSKSSVSCDGLCADDTFFSFSPRVEGLRSICALSLGPNWPGSYGPLPKAAPYLEGAAKEGGYYLKYETSRGSGIDKEKDKDKLSFRSGNPPSPSAPKITSRTLPAGPGSSSSSLGGGEVRGEEAKYSGMGSGGKSTISSSTSTPPTEPLSAPSSKGGWGKSENVKEFIGTSNRVEELPGDHVTAITPQKKALTSTLLEEPASTKNASPLVRVTLCLFVS
jgi:hypothetical protein